MRCMTYMSKAFAPIMAEYKEATMQDTWGHFAPRKGKSYPGFVVFAIAVDGTYCLINYDFDGLDGSPWLYEALMSFIGDNAKEQGVVYQFEGKFRNYAFSGRITQIIPAGRPDTRCRRRG